MPPWATVTITLGASAIAVAGTLFGTWLQLRFSRRERKRTDDKELVERAGAVLGPIRTLLSDLDPDRIQVNLNAQTPDRLRRLRQRWLPLRDAVSTFAASTSAPRVTDIGAKLEVAVSNTISDLEWAVSQLLAHSGDREMLDRARGEHLRANILTRALLEAVRGSDVSELIERADAAGTHPMKAA